MEGEPGPGGITGTGTGSPRDRGDTRSGMGERGEPGGSGENKPGAAGPGPGLGPGRDRGNTVGRDRGGGTEPGVGAPRHRRSRSLPAGAIEAAAAAAASVPGESRDRSGATQGARPGPCMSRQDRVVTGAGGGRSAGPRE